MLVFGIEWLLLWAGNLQSLSNSFYQFIFTLSHQNTKQAQTESRGQPPIPQPIYESRDMHTYSLQQSDLRDAHICGPPITTPTYMLSSICIWVKGNVPHSRYNPHKHYQPHSPILSPQTNPTTHNNKNMQWLHHNISMLPVSYHLIPLWLYHHSIIPMNFSSLSHHHSIIPDIIS